MVKDNREAILIFKGKDIATVVDALELQSELYVDDKRNCPFYKNAYELLKKIREVMRID